MPLQYNLQFYNQGQYLDCNDLITKAGAPFPGSAVLEIMAAGVPGNKIVIGKPGVVTDATNGFMDPATIGTCVSQAAKGGWDGGLMSFQVRSRFCAFIAGLTIFIRQFPGADTTWIKAAKGPNFV